MEARYRRLQELISEVNRKIRELNDSARQGFKVGADTSRAEIAILRLTEMRDKFNNADIGNKNAVAELVSEYKILKNEIGNVKSEQDKLTKDLPPVPGASGISVGQKGGRERRLPESVKVIYGQYLSGWTVVLI